MKLQKIFSYLTLILLFSACDTVTDNNINIIRNGNDNSQGNWLIPENEVVRGAGRDQIPSIDNPKFAPVDQINYVADNRLVIGIKIGNTIKAYPHQVMDYHEIVNDRIGDTPFALTYCPLTGTAIAWKRIMGGDVVEFGVSGLLFRNNLIPYDRKTNSRYSQMRMRGVNGVKSGLNLQTIPVIQTTWSTWKKMFPESKVLTTETGFSRNYRGFAYGQNYLNGDTPALFPVKNVDNRLPAKERVHGVIADQVADQDATVRVYVINDFGPGINLIKDSRTGGLIIIAGSSEFQFAVSFKRSLKDGTLLKFEPVQNALPVIMKDQEGNFWTVFGLAVKGPRKGTRLTPTKSYSGYWFAWADFFPHVEIYPGLMNPAE